MIATAMLATVKAPGRKGQLRTSVEGDSVRDSTQIDARSDVSSPRHLLAG
jgi:hypothetical protein